MAAALAISGLRYIWSLLWQRNVELTPPPVELEPLPEELEPPPMVHEPLPEELEAPQMVLEPLPVEFEPPPMMLEPLPEEFEPPPMVLEPLPEELEPPLEEWEKPRDYSNQNKERSQARIKGIIARFYTRHSLDLPDRSLQVSYRFQRRECYDSHECIQWPGHLIEASDRSLWFSQGYEPDYVLVGEDRVECLVCKTSRKFQQVKYHIKNVKHQRELIILLRKKTLPDHPALLFRL